MGLLWHAGVRSDQVGAGVFYCPRCGTDRTYAQKLSRRWLRVLFLPAVPREELSQYVECASCRDGFDVDVLALPTLESLRLQLLRAVRETVVLLLEEGSTPVSRAEAVAMLTAFAERPWTHAELDADREQLDCSRLGNRLRLLATVLSPQGKERVVSWAARVATADGSLGSRRAATVESIGADLDMAGGTARRILLRLAGQAA